MVLSPKIRSVFIKCVPMKITLNFCPKLRFISVSTPGRVYLCWKNTSVSAQISEDSGDSIYKLDLHEA